MNSCKKYLEDGSVDLQKEIYPEADKSQYFIPNRKAKHRAYPKHLAYQIHLKRGRSPKQHKQKKKVIKVDTSDGETSEDEATNQNIAVPSEKEKAKLIDQPSPNCLHNKGSEEMQWMQ